MTVELHFLHSRFLHTPAFCTPLGLNPTCAKSGVWLFGRGGRGRGGGRGGFRGGRGGGGRARGSLTTGDDNNNNENNNNNNIDVLDMELDRYMSRIKEKKD
ncbi:hypothetical protein BDC45DRAFT_569931 [Circinella umbellata]|nr:hypothetical protein BDC45DRAFT_569931 [Circinella umbellata]